MSKPKKTKRGAAKVISAPRSATQLNVQVPAKSKANVYGRVGRPLPVQYIRVEVMAAIAAGGQQIGASYYLLYRRNIAEIKGLPYPQHLGEYIALFENEPQLDALWILHKAVSAANGYGIARIEEIESHIGFFVWAPPFENVHTVWSFPEPGFTAKGQRWRGPENFYQFAKMRSDKQTDKLRREVASMTESKVYEWGSTLRKDYFVGRQSWEEQREKVMKKAVQHKFEHPNLMRLLRSTRGLPLVSVKDGYWGYGGSNALGKILEDIRDEWETYKIETCLYVPERINML